jgi:hypothetical protein
MIKTMLEVPLDIPLPMVAPNLFVSQPSKIQGYEQFPVLHYVQYILKNRVVYRGEGGVKENQTFNIQKAR